MAAKRTPIYARLGKEPTEDQPDGVYYANIYDYVPKIDPLQYFITSGEAILKAEKLEADLWKAAGLAKKFVSMLKKAKASAKFLETSVEDETIIILKRKNPRVKAQP